MNKFYHNFGKRLFDVVIGIFLLVLLLPLLVITGLAVLCFTGRPIFYIQTRIGKHGKEFRIYKFRSMTVSQNRLANQTRIGDSDVTWIGVILRRTKIDELPQLFNLLRGDISLVGPRPCLPQTVATFNDNGLKRLEVSPGITGLAQVNGNIELSWAERWIYDAKYVETLSFWLDLKIIIKTIFIVIFGEEKFLKRPKTESVKQSEIKRKDAA
jgi:lipopolysaccharide/colanic/teichoic acid biosynthesis glycosyltransferase